MAPAPIPAALSHAHMQAPHKRLLCDFPASGHDQSSTLQGSGTSACRLSPGQAHCPGAWQRQRLVRKYRHDGAPIEAAGVSRARLQALEQLVVQALEEGDHVAPDLRLALLGVRLLQAVLAASKPSSMTMCGCSSSRASTCALSARFTPRPVPAIELPCWPCMPLLAPLKTPVKLCDQGMACEATSQGLPAPHAMLRASERLRPSARAHLHARLHACPAETARG